MGDTGRVPALDGLRGLAVLLVLVGHSRLPGLSQAAGAGVVVFFVLSGYLFAHILGREVERTGTVDLRRFWLRRARRLLPALVVMVVGVGALVVAVGYPLGLYARDAGWTLGYAANWGIIGGHDLGPMSHTWSLAVEEHFYLLWPLVMLAFGRHIVASGRSPTVLAGVAGVLIVWRLGLLATGHTAWAYIGDEGSMAALLAGCAVGIAQRQGRTWHAPRLVLAVGLAVGCVGWAVSTPARQSLAVAATPLVICAVVVTLPRLPTWLGRSPMRGLGRISYGVYLWHFPLTFLAVGLAYPWRGLFGAALAVPIAWASWRWIEQPILTRAARPAATTQGEPTAAPLGDVLNEDRELLVSRE